MSEAAHPTEINPLRQALPRTRVPEPCAMVLFGATGDLAHRKLVPALFQLARGGNLPAEYAIVGFARRDWTDEDLRSEYQKTLAREAGGPDFSQLWSPFADRLFFAVHCKQITCVVHFAHRVAWAKLDTALAIALRRIPVPRIIHLKTA